MTWAEVRELDAGSWFDSKFAGEEVPTIEEVLKLVAEYRQHDILIAADLKVEGVEEEVVRLAEKYKVLDRLLFIGRTITESEVRNRIRRTSSKASTAVVANNADEFAESLAASNADWVYFRFLPTQEQIDAMHRAQKRSFIAGPTVSGNLPDNWRHAAEVRMDGILTDYPLELRATLNQIAANDK
jgi:glycerophosphoryl diester phosphodiesterase